jgi:conjugative relaxase-like TrwC/TraI family protein
MLCGMIRMNQSTNISVEQAKDYFDDALLQTGYYLNGQELNGQFQGKVAERLGIVGTATHNIFHDLCENIHPLTGKSLTPLKVDNRTIYYDINFHCPKSVSVLHVLANDGHILDAF